MDVSANTDEQMQESLTEPRRDSCNSRPLDIDVENTEVTPAPRFVIRPADKCVLANDTAILEAHISGDPEPIVRWFRNGHLITTAMFPRLKRHHYIPETYILEIPGATESDVGSYTCAARNCYGSVTSSATVKILDLETQYPCFLQRLQRTDVFAGRKGYLPVKVSGFPKPDVKWFKNSRPLIENDHIEFRHYGPHSHVLNINDAEPKDSGLYTCQARNNIGIASSSAMVNVESNDKFNIYKPIARDWSVDCERIHRQIESRLRPDKWSQRDLDDYLYRLSVANYHIKYRTPREGYYNLF